MAKVSLDGINKQIAAVDKQLAKLEELQTKRRELIELRDMLTRFVEKHPPRTRKKRDPEALKGTPGRPKKNA